MGIQCIKSKITNDIIKMPISCNLGSLHIKWWHFQVSIDFTNIKYDKKGIHRINYDLIRQMLWIKKSRIVFKRYTRNLENETLKFPISKVAGC